MFDAEKLLGKVLREAMGSSHGKTGKSYKKKHKSSLISNLTSGAGLMTAIGLGIGAFEILKNKNQPQPPAGHYAPPAAASPPPIPGSQPVAAPPQPPSWQPAAATPPPASAINSSQELAIRLIQAMIAAAHADGTMDEQEEQAVLDRLKGEDLSQEEKMFLLTELHNPKSIEELVAGVTDPSAAKAMYMLAVSGIEIDTDKERLWLDELAGKLGLSKAVQKFIEEQA